MEESNQLHRTGAIAANVLMIIALFMPSFSIMGKLTGSFSDVTVAFIRAREWMPFLAFLIMLIAPVCNAIIVLASSKHRTTIGAYVPAGGLLLFMLAMNAILPKSQYYDTNGLVEYKIGFYAYLLASIILIIISLSWPKTTDHNLASGSGSTFDSVMKWLTSDHPMRFLPLDFMNSFETNHFSQVCGDTPVSAKIARFGLVTGMATTCVAFLFASFFEIRGIIGLLFAIVVVVVMACVFLLPVFKGSYATIDKVIYSLFIIITAMVCTILGAVFNSLVLIYVVLFLLLYAIRQYYAQKRRQSNQ